MGKHALSFEEALQQPLTGRNAQIVVLSLNPFARIRQLSQWHGRVDGGIPFPNCLSRRALVSYAEKLDAADRLLDLARGAGAAVVRDVVDTEPLQEPSVISDDSNLLDMRQAD